MLEEVISDLDLNPRGEVAPFRVMDWGGFLYPSSAEDI